MSGAKTVSPFRDRLQNFFQDADFHGLKRSLKAEATVWSKVFWIVVFSGSIAFMSVQIYIRFNYFFSWPVSTRYYFAEADSIAFPSLTVCNMNTFKRSKITAQDMLHIGHELFTLSDKMEFLEPSYFADDPAFLERFSAVNWSEVRANLTEFNYTEFVERVASKPSDTIPEFHSHGTPWSGEGRVQTMYPPPNFLGYEKCSILDTSAGQDNSYGYTLNSSIANLGSALGVAINIEPDEYTWKDSSSWASPSVWFDAHTPGTYTNVVNQGDLLSMGIIYVLKVRAFRFIGLPAPYGTCVNASERTLHFLPEVTQGVVHKYSSHACLQECYMEQVAERCNCRYYWQAGSLPVCNNSTQRIECFKVKMNEMVFASKVGGLDPDAVSCDCPMECDSFKYSFTFTPVKPNPRFQWGFNATKGAYIYMYFDTMVVETIQEEVAFGLSALISDVGGNMGLFIGASVLTVLHLLEFTMSEFSICWMGKGRSKKVTSDPTKNTTTAAVQTHGRKVTAVHS